jgi:hypothetical protein
VRRFARPEWKSPIFAARGAPPAAPARW